MLGTKNMSNENEAADEVCASCGRPAVDDIKLKKCACNLVKYCGVACQKNHRLFVKLLGDQPEGKYVIMRDPNRAVVRIYGVPMETFEESDEEDDDDDEEEGEDGGEE
jgi:hypothetical protein